MKTRLMTILAGLLLLLAVPVANAGDTKFGGVSPRAESNGHARYIERGYYDRGYTHREYRRNQTANRSRNRNYRYGPRYGTRDYTRSPIIGYAVRSHRSGYHRHSSRYGYYYRDGIRITPYGVTIFLNLGD